MHSAINFAPILVLVTTVMAGHAGEFSGYYCKFANIVDHELLSTPSGSHFTEEVTIVTAVSKCIGDPANYSSFEPEQPVSQQQWLMVWMPEVSAYRIINRNSGMLLCVQSRTDKENHRIVQYHDQCLNFQWWELQAIDMDRFKIVNKKSRKVLTSKAGSVVQQTWDSSAQALRQLWNISVLEHSGYIGEYQIRNVNYSKLLCIKGQSLNDGARAIAFDDVSLSALEEQYANYQSWRLYVRGWDRGGFVIQNSHSGKILSVSSQSVLSGGKIIQHQNQELPHQKWSFKLIIADHLKVVNTNSTLFLTIQDDPMKLNLVAIQSEDQNQCWELIKLSGDSKIDFHKLVGFYNSSAEHTIQVRKEYLSMSLELQKWYEAFLGAFLLEVMLMLGVFPTPSHEDLSSIVELILSNSYVVAELQSLLKDHGASFDSEAFVSIFSIFWDSDLWSAVFKCLLRPIWSLQTLVKATVTIRSFMSGAGTARTIFLLNKAVLFLGNLCRMKPQ